VGDWCLVSARARQAGERLFRGALPSFARPRRVEDPSPHNPSPHDPSQHNPVACLGAIGCLYFLRLPPRWESWFGTGTLPGYRITIIELSNFSVVAIESLSLICHHQIAIIGDRYDHRYEVGFAGAGT